MAQKKHKNQQPQTAVKSSSKPALPESTSSFLLNCACLTFFGGLLYLLFVELGFVYDEVNLALVLLLSILPMFLLDFNRDKIAGRFKKHNEFSLLRIVTKLTGLYITYLLLKFIFWLFPLLGERTFKMLTDYAVDNFIWVAIISLPYMIIVDMFLPKPKDSYWHVGNLIIRQQKPDWRMVAEHAKAWIVKFFFFLLMITSLYGSIGGLLAMSMKEWDFVTDASSAIKLFYSQAHKMAYGIDLVFAAVGYVMTFKLLGTNIRSTEPTTLGWLACIICYPPFWPLVSSKFFNYNDGYDWHNHFSGDVPVYALWAAAILACDLIYCFATVAFGYRFSNLTYRGIITGGPYRFTKHPAYAFKNISWWLTAIPFISFANTSLTIKYCLALLCVNIIYYVRARTEENHLSNYPEYVAYAEAMNQRSIFRPLVRFLPFLKYSKERALREGRQVYKPFADQ